MFYFYQTVNFMACIRHYAKEKIVRTSKNSPNVGVVWQQNYANMKNGIILNKL